MHSVFCTSRLGLFTLIKLIAFRSQKKKKKKKFSQKKKKNLIVVVTKKSKTNYNKEINIS